MSTPCQLPRRTFLKGLGITLGLPWLEAMTPATRLLAGEAGSVSSTGLPRRMAFVYVPNGADMANWTPAAEGNEFALPPILEPLHDLRNSIQVISGLAHDKAKPNGDGAGDHARACATFLTGCQARKTAGADLRVGVSVDQIAAARVGGQTRLPSLELSCDPARQAGNCDSGYSCAYQFNLSWRSESNPVPPECNPRLAFERLFGNPDDPAAKESLARRRLLRKSILDFALDDARQLRARLGATDRRKLDEYLTSIREIERRVESTEQGVIPRPNLAIPDAVPQDYEQHIRLMFDLLVLAFQTDTTRIATFLIAHDGSNRSYPFIGVREGHHDLSHHEGKEEKKAKIAKINRFHITQFAWFLVRLRSVREGNGTLLDQCMIVYGSGLADGNSHSHEDLPVLLAGGGGGTLRPGRHVRLSKTPMTNLYLALLDRMGASVERLGDSTGSLKAV